MVSSSLILALGGGSGALGCSSAAGDFEQASGGGGYEPGDANDWPDPAAPGEGTGAAEDGGSSGDDGAGTSDGSDGGTDEPPRGDDDGTFAGCPQPLPGSWVFCEDFETIVDPADVALDYQDLDGAFRLVDETGASGHRSMQVTYREGEEAAGWMVLSFGASPLAIMDRPVYAPDGSFEEIYWRLRIKTEPGWPDVGPGGLTRTISFAGADWSEAVVAELRSAGQDVMLEGAVSSCVTGYEIACAGFDDRTGLESLGSLVGELPLFSEAESGRWHCVEGHLKLNTPGAADGVFEFSIDDQEQAGRNDLDLRGSWVDFGINAVVVENEWPGGAPGPLRRWIDDVVISTEPIGCTPGPAGATPE